MRRIARFLAGLFRRPAFRPGTVADSPDMEFEKELRRGVRGD